MKRPAGRLLAAMGIIITAGCTATTATTTTTLPAIDTRTTSTVPPTTSPTTFPSTTVRQVEEPIVTTVAPIPEALPLVAAEWDWELLQAAETPVEARFDGTYLVWAEPWEGRIRVAANGIEVLQHQPPTDEQWITQDIELGDHWLGIAENTEGAGDDRSHVVVYDLATGEPVVDRSWTQYGETLFLPDMSISGRYMTLTSDADNNCVEVYDLATQVAFDEICADTRPRGIELDGPFVAYDTRNGECLSAWTADLYTADHAITAHGYRECRANAPIGGDRITVWFESESDSDGVDTMLGTATDGATVGLRRGERNFAEVCWNYAYWKAANGDIRMWDGGDSIRTILQPDERKAYNLGCVGPWVTFSTAAGIYTANVFTRSGLDACALTRPGDQPSIEEALATHIADRFDDLPDDLEISVEGAVEMEGWWAAVGSFSSNLESALFLGSPEGDISVAWSGNADSEYDIRHYMLAGYLDTPPALLGCVNVAGFVG